MSHGRTVIIPGCEHIDNMRRILSKIEFQFMDQKEPPSPIELSTMLIGLENSQRYLEAAICDEIGNGAETALSIDRLSAFESHELFEQI